MLCDKLIITSSGNRYTLRDIVLDRKFKLGFLVVCILIVILICIAIAGHHSTIHPQHECSSHDDCSKNMSCNNNKCVDPCHGVCGVNATCRVFDHRATCACPEGHKGDVFESCSPHIEESQLECTTHDKCSVDKGCIQNKCIDPCIGSCGTNAKCTVVNHETSCSCREGYTGDASVECIPVNKECLSISELKSKKKKRYEYQNGVKQTWAGAFAYCLRKNGLLATINTKEENDMIKEEIVNAVARYHDNEDDIQFWTSGIELLDTHRFVWMTTGQPFNFTDWGSGQPNNFNSENEDCMAIRKKNLYPISWNDAKCISAFPFICEYYD